MAQSIGATGTQFQIGRVISTSLAVLGRNLVPFLLLAVAIGIPYLVVQISLIGSIDMAAVERTGQIPDGFFGMMAIVFIIGMLTYVMTQAVIIYGTVQDLRGQKAGFGASLSHGFAVLPKVLIAAILATIAISIGLMLLVVPGVILILMWWVFVPVMVVEGAGIGAGFGRSRALTSGHRWQILGLLVIVFVAQMLIGLVVDLFAALAGPLVGQIINAAVMFLFTAFAGVLAAVGYYHLRAEKEGVIIEDIAKVFD
jgi:hypothetical protein